MNLATMNLKSLPGGNLPGSKVETRICAHCKQGEDSQRKIWLVPVRFSAWPRTSDTRRGIWDGYMCETCIQETWEFLNQSK